MKYEHFLNFFDWLVENCKEPVELPSEVQEVYEMLKIQQEVSKPAFTETGLAILEYMQTSDNKAYKAKEIAEGMLMSSRKISGAMRKLVTDGYVDKMGANPVIYSLTENGKNFDIMNYKKENNNG